MGKINITSCNKKQLNSLIKFLRPKVYITNSSNFKNLVQESEHPTQNRKSMHEVTDHIINPFRDLYIINDRQVYSLNVSHQESISQDLSFYSNPKKVCYHLLRHMSLSSKNHRLQH